MQRITITLEDELFEQFERFLAEQAYHNRSEAFRDLIRERLGDVACETAPDGNCVATLTYVFDHHARDLAGRMTRASHAHHDLVVSTMHVHLDHDHCMETTVLRGSVARVSAFGKQLMAQPGVHHARLHLVPVAEQADSHAHGGEPGHAHSHLTPLA